MKSSCIGFLFYAIAGSVLYTLNAKAQRIRGTPGVDYPNHHTIPKTSFKCSEQKYIPGFYADLDTDCQVFHFCYSHRQESFLCPTGTTFNQPILACDSWYSSNCSLAPLFYSVNSGSGIANSRTIPMLLKLRDRAKINSPVTSTEAVFDKISSLYESSTELETKVKDANGEIQTSGVLVNESSNVKDKEQDPIKLPESFVKYANQNAENSSQVEEKLAEKPVNIQSQEEKDHRKAKSSSEISESTLEELRFLSELYQAQTEDDSYVPETDGDYIDNSGFPKDILSNEQEGRQAKSSSEINESTQEELKFLSELYQGQTEEDSYDAATDGYYMDDYNLGFPEVQREERDGKAKSSSEINESTLEELKFLSELYQGQTEADYDATEGYYMDDYNSGFLQKFQRDEQNRGAESSDEINESTLEELKFLQDLYQRQTEANLVYDPITEGYYMDNYESSKTEWQQDSDSIGGKFQNFYDYRNSAEFDDQMQDESELQFQENDLDEQFGKTKDSLEVQTESLPEDITFVEDYESRSASLDEMADFSKRILQKDQNSKRYRRKPMYIVIEDEPEIELSTKQRPNLYPVVEPVERTKFASADRLTGYNADLPNEFGAEKNKTNKNYEENVEDGSDKNSDFKNSFAENYRTSMPLTDFNSLEISDSGEQRNYENEDSEVEQILEDELSSNKDEAEGEIDYSDPLAYSDITREGFQSDTSFEYEDSNVFEEETYPAVVYDNDEQAGYKSETYSDVVNGNYDEQFEYKTESYPYSDNIGYEILDGYKSDDSVEYGENESELDIMQSLTEDYRMVADDSYRSNIDYEENYSSEPMNEIDPDLAIEAYESDDTELLPGTVREQNSPELTMEENDESFIVIPDATDSEDGVSNSQSSDWETRYNLGSDTLSANAYNPSFQMDESHFGIGSQPEYDSVGDEQTEDIESESYDDTYGSINGPQDNFESEYQEIDSRVHPEGYNLISNIETREVPESDYQYMVQNQESPSSAYEFDDSYKILEYAENPESSRFDFQDDLSRSNYEIPRNLFSTGISNDGSYSYGYVQPVDYVNYPYGTQFGYFDENGDSVVLLNENIENQRTISAETGAEYMDLDHTAGLDIAINPEYSVASKTGSWIPTTYKGDSDGTESKKLSDAAEYLQFEEEGNNSTNSFADGILKISEDSEVMDSNSSVSEDAVNLFGLKIDENEQNEETYFVFDSNEDTDGQASEVMEDFSSYKVLETNDDVSESAEQSYEKEQIESKEVSENLDGRDVLTHGEIQSSEAAAAVDIPFNAKDIPAQMKSSLPIIDKYSSNSASQNEVVASLNDKGKIFDAESEVNADGTLSGMNSKQIIDTWSPNTRLIDQANKKPTTQSTFEQLTDLKPVKTQSFRNNFQSPTETEFLNKMAFQNSMNLEPFGFGSNTAQQFSRMESSNSIPFKKLEGSFSSQAEESEKSRLSKLSLLQDKVRSMKQGKFGMFKKYMNSMKKQ